MNIGIDIDGVLTDIHAFNLKHAPPYFKRKWGMEVVDETPYDIRDMFKCTNAQWFSYWRKHLIKYATHEPARKGANDFTIRLHEDGHEVYVISKRVFTYKKTPMGKLMRRIVRKWLRKNEIKYKSVIFCDNSIPDSKKTACIKNKIEIMIDDEPININAIAPIAKVICYDTTYNRQCEGENIHRAKNYEEAYKIIKEIQ